MGDKRKTINEGNYELEELRAQQLEEELGQQAQEQEEQEASTSYTRQAEEQKPRRKGLITAAIVFASFVLIVGVVGVIVGSFLITPFTQGWDISEGSRDDVMAFLELDKEETGKLCLVIKGDGRMQDYDHNEAPWIKIYGSFISTAVFERGVTNIGDCSFEYLPHLSRVEISNSVTEIGSYAFSYCNELKEIELPKDLTSIGSGAFTNTGISKIVIPDGVTEIKDATFFNCQELTEVSIGKGVKKLYWDAFGFCPKLEALFIPIGVTETEWGYGELNYTTKYYCEASEWPGGWPIEGDRTGFEFGANNITTNEDYDYVLVDDEAYLTRYKGEATTVIVPSTVDGYEVVSIGGCFAGNEAIISVAIPEGITEIESRAFYNCRGLSSIELPEGLTTIKAEAFYECSSLNSIIIPKSVKTIGESALSHHCVTVYCRATSQPKGWHENWWNDWEGSALIWSHAHATEVGVCACGWSDPDRVELAESWRIGSGTTANLYKSLTKPNAYTLLLNGQGETDNWTSGETPWKEYADYIEMAVVGDSVTSIGNSAFSRCTNLIYVYIGKNVRSIGISAFFNCSSIKSINIPSNVESIDMSAFASCSMLSSVKIGAGVESIGTRAFGGCGSIVTIEVDSNNRHFKVVDGNLYSYDGTKFIRFASLEKNEHLILPSTVTSIEEGAFDGCDKIKSVVISGSVQKILSSAFNGCTYLESVTIENGVKEIGSFAFQSCNSLTRVTIPGSVSHIGNSAFGHCERLETVVMETGVNYLDHLAFVDDKALVTVVIPSTVTTIGSYNVSAFLGCDNATFYCAAKTEPSGWMDNWNCDRPVIWGYERTAEWDISLTGSDKVTAYIGVDPLSGGACHLTISGTGRMKSFSRDNQAPWMALYGDKITRVTIEEGVTAIGDEAFNACQALVSVEIAGTVTSIGYKAFYSCASLESIAIPNSVTTVGNEAFAECKALARVDMSSKIEAISEKMFYNCSALEEIDIPKTATAIGNSAFYNCGLKFIKLPKGVKTIGENAFAYCTNLSGISIPDGLTTIGDYAFSGCGSLASIFIPKSITYMGSYAFEHGWAMTIYVEGSEPWDAEWGTEWYPGSEAPVCHLSHAYTINSERCECGRVFDYEERWDVSSTSDDKVTAFLTENTDKQGSYTLTIVSSGNGKMASWSLGKRAPWHELYGDKITRVIISEGVTTIGDYAFYESSLESVEIAKTVTAIGKSAFEYCRSLTTVKIPESMVSIDAYAFCECTALTRVVLWNGVKTIGTYAFSKCTSLKSICIPTSVAEINDYAFSDCAGLTVYCEAQGQPSAWSSGWSYSVNSIKWAHAHTYEGEDCVCGMAYPYVEKWDISASTDGSMYAYILKDPNQEGCYLLTIKGSGEMKDWEDAENPWYSSYKDVITGVTIEEGVTTIGAYAFRGLEKLVSLEMPSSLMEIGYYAFTNCNSLAEITIPSGVTSISEHAFYHCEALKTITLPSTLVSIGTYALAECTRLSTVVIPDSVEELGTYVFSGCTGLSKVTLPSGLDALSEGLFNRCTALRTVEIPSSVTVICQRAFYWCTNLTSIVIPNGVTDIGEFAFYKCENLASIEIPSSVANISKYAFSTCTGLTSVVISSGVTTIGELAFAHCKSLESIYIPNSVTTIDFLAFEDCTKLTIYCEAESQPSTWASSWNDSSPVEWGSSKPESLQ